jgi:hypothetical protein
VPSIAAMGSRSERTSTKRAIAALAITIPSMGKSASFENSIRLIHSDDAYVTVGREVNPRSMIWGGIAVSLGRNQKLTLFPSTELRGRPKLDFCAYPDDIVGDWGIRSCRVSTG